MSDYPQPVNYRILVKPLELSQSTPSGIQRMSDDEWIMQSKAMDVGYVLRMGPTAFEEASLQDPERGPPIKEGDKIRFRKFAGHEYRDKDELGIERGPFYRVINDEDVLEIIEEGSK